METIERCFGDKNPLYAEYHDTEWGVPIRDEQALFEQLSLEIFACGLSWLTVLRKRAAFREAFASFEIPVVAAFTDSDVTALMSDAALVRNEAKIKAVIGNAQAVVRMHQDCESLTDLFWTAAPRNAPVPTRPRDIPSSSSEAIALTKTLHQRGVRWIGPVTIYATMQAAGMVNDHLVGCPRRAVVAAQSQR
jgi:DNA-3-methyladenine glycosylase I